MGEISIAIFVGGWMVFLGLFMNVILGREERRYKESSNLEKGEKLS